MKFIFEVRSELSADAKSYLDASLKSLKLLFDTIHPRMGFRMTPLADKRYVFECNDNLSLVDKEMLRKQFSLKESEINTLRPDIRIWLKEGDD